ncbi:hypothetical protein ACOMHN_026903 [Nucella lapillus]
MDGDGDIQDGSSGGTQDCRDIDDGGYGLDYSEDIIPDDDNVSNEAQPITGGQSQGIAAQEPKRKKAKSRPASASEAILGRVLKDQAVMMMVLLVMLVILGVRRM